VKRVHTGVALVLLLASAGTALADNAESLLVRSRAAARAGNWDAASRLAQSAIVADPKRVSSYVALADLYLHSGHPDFASFYYAEALQLDPQNKEAQAGLAVSDREAKKQTAAAEHSLDKKNNDH
jgi:Tfp pilus assembly protein PilF